MSSIVLIDEASCIGCTKCIAACPVDAIFGASKMMHTVIASECIGCNLCIPACPVDCISVQVTTSLDKEKRLERAKLTRQRVTARKLRLEKIKHSQLVSETAADKKVRIREAIEKARARQV